MKNHVRILFAASIAATMIAGCAKSGVKVGNEAPQIELQKCIKLSDKKKFEEAVECLEIFKSRFAQTEYGREAELAIADSHFNNKEYLLAADTYQAFIKMHPTNPKIDYAFYRLGLSYLMESPKAIDRDQQYLDDAINYLNVAAVSFPNSAYHESALTNLKEARSRVAKRTYYIGNFYYRTGEYRSAVPRFIDLVNEFPESDLVPKALYKLVVSAGELKKINESKVFYSKLSTDYPGNRWTNKAESKIKSYLKAGSDSPDVSTQPITPEVN